MILFIVLFGDYYTSNHNETTQDKTYLKELLITNDRKEDVMDDLKELLITNDRKEDIMDDLKELNYEHYVNKEITETSHTKPIRHPQNIFSLPGQ